MDREEVTAVLLMIATHIPIGSPERSDLARLVAYITNLENALDVVPGGWSFVRKEA